MCEVGVCAAFSQFVAGEGVLRLRTLATGQRNPFGVEVLNGIREGTPAVWHPTNELTVGMRVTPR